jgi:transcriptional regulator with XRE-family HTH domain
MNALKIVADNLTALIQDQKDRKGPLSSLVAIEAATAKTGMRVPRSTIDRIRKGEAASEFDKLEAIAKAFGLEVWQFLVPGLVPGQPPALRGSSPQDDLSDEALEIAVQLDSISDHETREVAVAKAYTAAFRLQRPSGQASRQAGQSATSEPLPAIGKRPGRP